ncbi:MAG: SagB/ThcOx family dehydrogenase [Thermodesulfobacteriota bacterium]|jgi:SagB-type dehydrogenase family enzyme
MLKNVNRREFLKTTAATGAILIAGDLTSVFAEELKPIELPKPRVEGGKPLMEALKERKSSRSFRSEKIPMQVLSDMLWAAWGVNRPDEGRRTAPSAKNNKEIDIYVVLAEGVYLYDAKDHILSPVLAQDIREMASRNNPRPLDTAPVVLLFVADFARMAGLANEQKVLFSAADTGFISQNVYLYCASEGLATVVRGILDRPALAKAMKLRPEQNIVLAQSVGYPKG